MGCLKGSMTSQALGGVNPPCGWYRVRGQPPSTGGGDHTHTHTQRTSTKCGPNMCPLMGDYVLLQGSTTYGSTMYSSSKKAGTKQTDSNR
jgi:hypothetical protein